MPSNRLPRNALANLTKGWEKTLFPQHVWLDKARGGETHVTLHASQAESEKAKASLLVDKKYVVSVTTADCKGAGTDANVFVELLGANGNSGRRPLSTSRNNFERGKKDVFFLEMPDLGELSAIKIGHDNAGMGPGWCLDRVIVSDEDAPGEATVFDASVKGKPGGRWLDKSADGGATQCTLAPLAANAGAYYGVETMTSDVMFAGTDANVSLTLIGLKDGKETRSKTMKLDNSSNNFDRGALDVLDVRHRAVEPDHRGLDQRG